MKISEIFYSIQGEGMLTGVPSVFVRTSGCNLRCVWCDTPYTSWAPEGSDMPVDTILACVKAHPARHAVVTGGEPMIAPQIVELTQGVKNLGLHVTMETAGTVYHKVACDLMSISPKLANSTPHEREGGKEKPEPRRAAEPHKEVETLECNHRHYSNDRNVPVLKKCEQPVILFAIVHSANGKRSHAV